MSAQHTQEDGFHEIQLNGKQLVFLFMAATVVSVAIFLLGVAVGRSVRAQGGSAVADAGSAVTPPAPDTPAAVTASPQAAVPGSDPTKAAPPDPADDLSYFNRLEKQNAPAEQLKAEKPEKSPAPAPVAAPPPAPKPAPAEPSKAAPVASQGDGGYALQVAALRERGEAEAIAKRLSSKGYSAYVLAPATGTPSVYRVRVGQFKTRHDAETVAARLQKEEQFKPWITR